MFGLDYLNFSIRTICPHPVRIGVVVLYSLGSTGCASIAKMTADFNRKWEDPNTAIAELEADRKSDVGGAAIASQMARANESECSGAEVLVEETQDAVSPDLRGIEIGECFLEKGRNEHALAQFMAVTDTTPNAVASQGAGIALIRMGRFDEARSVLATATELDPMLWRAWNAQGVADDTAGDTEKAWENFRRAAEINSKDGAALNNLGVSQLKAGLVEEAITSFKAALAREGVREAAEANLRLALAFDGDYSGSVRALTDDRRVIALNNAGIAAMSRGDDAEAKKLFERAIEESPSFYAKAYNNLSLLVD